MMLQMAPAAAAPAPPAVMSKSEYAAYRGCKPPYISKLIRKDKLRAPALRPDGRIDRALADDMLARHADPARNADDGPGEAAAGGLGGPSYADERAKSEGLKRELLQIELDQARGRLIEKADVESAVFGAARTMRDGLLGLPARLAGDLSTMTSPGEIRSRLEADFRGLLEAFERDFTRAATGADAGDD